MPRHRAPLFVVLSLVLAACGTSARATEPPTAAAKGASPQPTQPAVAPPLPGSYAALGASETYGVGAVPRTRGYAFLLSRSLHARHFADLGIPGTTLDAAYNTELTGALAARPSLATLFFGFNDLRAGASKALFVQDLHDLSATLLREHARVVIIGIPDLSVLPAVAAYHIPGLRQIVASWNAGMKKAAKQTGAYFLDLTPYSRELATHPKYVAPDGLHPSNAGHARLAQVVLKAIRVHHLWKTH